jgi:hypothetical protein
VGGDPLVRVAVLTPKQDRLIATIPGGRVGAGEDSDEKLTEERSASKMLPLALTR